MIERARKHWNEVYASRPDTEVTWFQDAPVPSIDLVTAYLEPGQGFIDVGGGASRLVDLLAARGYGPLTVLDLSEEALEASRKRLGPLAGEVNWIAADVTEWFPGRQDVFAVWHDRAAFHFLVDEAARLAYARNLLTGLTAGGVAVIATFAEDGPEKCSGLPVRRYSPESLAAEFDHLVPGELKLIDSLHHAHATPRGNLQSFQYSVFRTS